MGKSKQADSVGDVVNGIERIAEAEDEVSIDDLLDEFGDRSFAPLMLILALMVFGWLWGMIGLLLAVPLLVCVKLVLERFGVARQQARAQLRQVQGLRRQLGTGRTFTGRCAPAFPGQTVGGVHRLQQGVHALGCHRIGLFEGDAGLLPGQHHAGDIGNGALFEPGGEVGGLGLRGADIVQRAFQRIGEAARGPLRRGGQRVSVSATREVVLSAGSIGSVQILQLSGIGPAPVLRAAGVEVKHELPGVGENLQDHLQIRSVYKVQGGKTLNTLANSLWGKASIGLEYALKRSGPMSMSPSQLGAFTKSDPAQPHANLEYHVQPLSLDAFGEPLHSFPAFTASVCNLNPGSRGHVRIRSARGEDAPAIAPNYLSTAEDRQVAADSLRVTRHIVAQPAMAKYRPEEFKPGVQYQTDDELARLAGDIASTIFHPVGTTKMGSADDPLAVVDSHLRVRGVAGLRVVDAGVMPTITSGNTNSPTLMIAEKAARWIARGI